MDTIQANVRDPKVKAKALRKAGYLPCSIFGAQLPQSISIQVNQTEAERLLRTKGIGSTVEVELPREKHLVLIKDVTRNTLKNEIENIEFQALKAGVKVNSSAPIVLINREKVPGFIGQILFEIPYSALPKDLLDTIVIDLEQVPANGRVMVKDLELASNENIQLLLDSESVILTIEEAKRGGEVEETEEEVS